MNIMEIVLKNFVLEFVNLIVEQIIMEIHKQGNVNQHAKILQFIQLIQQLMSVV